MVGLLTFFHKVNLSSSKELESTRTIKSFFAKLLSTKQSPDSTSAWDCSIPDTGFSTWLCATSFSSSQTRTTRCLWTATPTLQCTSVRKCFHSIIWRKGDTIFSTEDRQNNEKWRNVSFHISATAKKLSAIPAGFVMISYPLQKKTNQHFQKDQHISRKPWISADCVTGQNIIHNDDILFFNDYLNVKSWKPQYPGNTSSSVCYSILCATGSQSLWWLS